MGKIRVKPKEGVRVMDHLGRPIDPKGQTVCDNFLIRRLIKEGALVRMDKEAPAKKNEGDK